MLSILQAPVAMFGSSFVTSVFRVKGLWQLCKVWIGKGNFIFKSTSWATKYSLRLANTTAKSR